MTSHDAGHRVVRAVGAVIHDPAGRLLLVQRAHDPGAGLWSLPGGRVEPGESDAQALAREVREETGLAVTVGPVVGTVTRDGPDGVVFDIVDHACTVVAGDPVAASDAAAVRWAAPAELATLPVTSGLVEALTAWGVLDAG